MADVDLSQSRGKQKHSKKKKRRIGVKNDMTPMVDVAFLLLTFFMLTTTMAKPQTMEINLPPDEKVNVEVAESNLLTLRVVPDEKGKDTLSIYYNVGVDKPVKIAGSRYASIKALGKLLAEQNKANPKLITLLKIDKKAKYVDMVAIMDEFGLADIQRFSLAPMADLDKKILEKI
ncbi:MAG: ExbD/TolR family protein [Acidobacteriota bacterium]